MTVLLFSKISYCHHVKQFQVLAIFLYSFSWYTYTKLHCLLYFILDLGASSFKNWFRLPCRYCKCLFTKPNCHYGPKYSNNLVQKKFIFKFLVELKSQIQRIMMELVSQVRTRCKADSYLFPCCLCWTFIMTGIKGTITGVL